MTVQETIQNTLSEMLDLSHLEVINESSMHNVPKGSETHFRVIAVSAEFDRQPLVARHRVINDLLSEQIAGPIHALSLQTLTPEEWLELDGKTPNSPPCLGGSKFDKSN